MQIQDKQIDIIVEEINGYFNLSHNKNQKELRARFGDLNVIAKRVGSKIYLHIFSAFNARYKYGVWEFTQY